MVIEEQVVGERPSVWNNCYDDGWQGHIVDEAFAHPAKFSYGLIVRIVKHMLARGWIKKGELVADPFGGIGTGGIVCAANELRWLGVELEPRFVDLANRNFQLNPWTRNGEARIIQGDSRNFATLVGQCHGVVTSPPFATGDTADAQSLTDRNDKSAKWCRENLGRVSTGGYGRSPGQLASLPVGDCAAILTSPPYAEGLGHGGTGSETDRRKGLHAACDGNAQYGVTEGQLGAMKEGEIASVITSPPFERGVATADPNWLTPGERQKTIPSKSNQANYGQSDNQLGNTSGDTYWSAVAEIYRQCFLALKPGGYLACVVKSYVKAGKIVPLPEQTWELLQHVGFEPVERVRAMLVKHDDHPGLFEEKVRKTTKRVSFFRRLAERRGSPPIDFEMVLFLRKPL
jgi:hypothetical protein